METVDRLKIIQGSDRSPVLRLRNARNGDPFDLTGMTRIQVEFTNRDRTKLNLDTSTKPSTKAQITYEDAVFVAVTAGANGNVIILNFDGIETIAEVMTTWNNANPTNQVATTAPDTSIVLASGQTQLTDGYDSYAPIVVVGDDLLGKIRVTMLESETNFLRTGQNQSFKITIDQGQHPGGNRTLGLFQNKLDVIGSE